jgi:hypothetical protein
MHPLRILSVLGFASIAFAKPVAIPDPQFDPITLCTNAIQYAASLWQSYQSAEAAYNADPIQPLLEAAVRSLFLLYHELVIGSSHLARIAEIFK